MHGAVALRSGNAYISDDDTLISLQTANLWVNCDLIFHFNGKKETPVQDQANLQGHIQPEAFFLKWNRQFDCKFTERH